MARVLLQVSEMRLELPGDSPLHANQENPLITKSFSAAGASKESNISTGRLRLLLGTGVLLRREIV